MASSMFMVYIFSNLILKCCGIGPEVFVENELGSDDYSIKDTTPKDLRVGERDEELDIKNSTRRKDTFNHKDSNLEYVYEDDDFKIYVITEKIPPSQSPNMVTTNESSSNHQINISILRQNEPNQVNSTKTTISTILGFDEYQYIYEDEDGSEQPRQTLRHNINLALTDKISVIDDGSTIQYANESLRYFADFYNLEPAAGIINIKHPDIPDKLNSNIWYVPEKYPCWELPVLFAELGRRIKTSDVFLIYPGKLKNVVDTGKEDIPSSKNFVVPVAQSLNKWCAAKPCYGDHTLCIFSDKHTSKMCDKNYKVSAPTMTEQMALANTVNSMRNRVANGVADQYRHLPPAANMKQIIYDFDLEDMAMAWLRQCLPGPAPCSSLDNHYVTQLECTKYAERCCITSYKRDKLSKCIPEFECFVRPIIGCIHAWFCSAGQKLTETDVKCGHIAPYTYSTVQLFWAETNKIGCAVGQRSNGDVRVVCMFAPGAPFLIDTRYYCGFISHKDVTNRFKLSEDITDLKYLASLGINLQPVKTKVNENITHMKSISDVSNTTDILRLADLEELHAIYQKEWLRQKMDDYSNGTKGIMARLVTRYSFYEEGESRCDTDESIYISGKPGSMCLEKGRRFNALCYDFGDPTPGYRLVAVVAPVALFSLILYDLFSGVLRQTNY